MNAVGEGGRVVEAVMVVGVREALELALVLVLGAKAMSAEATAAVGVAQKASAAASVVWVTMARDT